MRTLSLTFTGEAEGEPVPREYELYLVDLSERTISLAHSLTLARTHSLSLTHYLTHYLTSFLTRYLNRYLTHSQARLRASQ